MTVIYFARHGEYHNPDNIIPYRLPGFPLTLRGQNQASTIGNNLRGLKLSHIYTSPILRARQTARIIGELISLKPTVTKLAIETYTPFQGIKKDDIARLSPNYPYDIPDHVKGGGDSPEAIFARMNTLVKRILTKHHSTRVLIVSHGDPIVIYLKAIFENRIPHLQPEFNHGKIKYPPMGSLVKVDYQFETPTFAEIL